MPETTSKNPRFARALARMQETHDAKSHDYATTANPYANFDFAQTLVERFGEPQDQVFATMVAIKLARLGELLGRGKTPKHESIEDTFLDLANYVVLWWTSRQRLADDAGASRPEPGVAPDPNLIARLTLEREELEDALSELRDQLAQNGKIRIQPITPQSPHPWMPYPAIPPVTCESTDTTGLSRSELEHWASMQPYSSTNTYVNDGNGLMWLKCGPTCDLHVERPGHMVCRCHATRFSDSI